MEVVSIDLQNAGPDYGLWLCEQLERGQILVLNPTPYLPATDDCAFLREQRQTQSMSHKNIAYKPRLQKMTGVDGSTTADAERLSRILAAFSDGALKTLARLLPHYARSWTVDYASFRPVEEAGRNLPMRHRNDLMHLDAFPTRPTHGGRILRAFTNIHPNVDRVWGTADDFALIAERYAEAAGLRQVTGPMATAQRYAARLARLARVRLPDRSPYDLFMLRFHHYLKANSEFQRHGQRHTFAFPPGATWITFTDQVAHRVVSGQFALEQTCITPYSAMILPDQAPVSVLERLAGRALVADRPLSAG